MHVEDEIVTKKMRGVVTVEVIRDGRHGPEVISREVTHNLIVNTGKKQTWRQAAGLSANAWDQFRIGTSGVAPVSSDLNVKSPVTGTLKTADSLTLLAGQRTFQAVISYPSGAGSKSAAGISEVVLLNQHTSPGGSAFMRAIFTPQNKTENDKLRITYQVRFG